MERLIEMLSDEINFLASIVTAENKKALTELKTLVDARNVLKRLSKSK